MDVCSGSTFRRDQCDQIFRLKICPFFKRCPKYNRFDLSAMSQTGPNVTKYLGYFCEKMCKYDRSNVAHTEQGIIY